MERLNYVDYAKGIAILLVVIGHLCQYNFEGENAIAVFNFIYSFHMPFFFFLSGYVVMMSSKIDDYKLFLIRKIQTLLLPFFSWGLFGVIIQDGSLSVMGGGKSSDTISFRPPEWSMVFGRTFLFSIIFYTEQDGK